MKMQGENMRNGEIDFLRFLFSLIILLRHSSNIVGKKWYPFLGGAFAVEFFFLVSGYLMMASIHKCLRGGDNCLLGRETVGFLTKKIKGFFPEMIIAWVLALLINYVAREEKTIRGFLSMLMDGFGEGSLLFMAGIGSTTFNVVVWYLSSMLISMAILYPLIRKYPDNMTKIILPVAVILMLGYLYQNYGTLRSPTQWIGFTYKGNIRAISEISLGVIGYEIVQHFSPVQLNKKGKVFLSVMKWCMYGVIIAYMWFRSGDRRDYIFLFVFWFAVMCSFSQKGIEKNFFQNQVCFFLGKFSLSIYLCHIFWAKNLNFLLTDIYSHAEKIGIYIICSFLTAIVVMLVSTFLRKHTVSIKGRLKAFLYIQNFINKG